MMVSWGGPPSWWDLFLIDFETLTISTAVGALLFGVIALLVCRKSCRPEKTPLPNQHQH
jgi:uncharacterized membrane protein YbhN (UPF0104 family)